MIKNIILLVFISIIVFILAEQLVMRRLQMSQGVEIKGGRCRLMPGYGKIEMNIEKK
jgi:hypothetical protein